MERKELIELFKNVERANYPVCNGCPLKYTCDKNQITRCLLGAAANMLKEDEKRIADCIAAIDALDDSNDAYIKENERLKKQIVELNTKCADQQSQINRMESEIKELLPKESVWMAHVGWDDRQLSQSATANVGTTFLCMSTGKLCPNATQYGYCKQTVCTIDSAQR